MNKNALIYVAGHRGLVGFTLLRKLNAVGNNIIIVRDHAQLDLINQKDVNDFFVLSDQLMYFYPQQKLAEYGQIAHIQRISFIRILLFKRMLLMLLIDMMFNVCFF